ncbi:hypothetical protein LTR10_022389 [Elasticomyces elasticus]|uniref:PHD-type domain-containing protein n=1 Tax=Exophiala sideris TaxID=1016849 RepID=A0ABR0IZ05_9EURO|nr:hypothetical protein LTR10_022389 [Elasticomyces elasticus]KAK5022613.1 hypothetical protein LTS07_009836 [Exophiala sideris]KAK5027724.1 hypothetical protein LTR13_009431 [Exophiala sideris]KAK5052188.1 hypothetical protein LTR69_009950 [Exophiala sideris]KAK5178015.1 hypothetical protein LTR44_009564 [Eurotiomycetes sp. CCFEE 6388]
MSTRSLRHRSSRYSSPATFAEKEMASKPTEAAVIRNGGQSSLDAWIEPPLRPAVPSFEDTKGLERLGVLENMQPLGVAPTQRMLQKLKLNYVRPSPRPTPVQPEEARAVATEPEKSDFASPLESEIMSDQPSEPPRQEDTVVISSPPRGRPPRKEILDIVQPANVSPSPGNLSLTPTSYVSPKPPSIQEHLRRDRLQTHLDRAVQEAQQKGSVALIPGLERLRDDAQIMPDLWNVLEAVVQQSPSTAQFKVFKRYIKSGIKTHRRASQISASPYQSTPQRFDSLTSPSHPHHSPNPVQPDFTSTGPPATAHPRISLYFNRARPQLSYGSGNAPVSPSTVVHTMEATDSIENPIQPATMTSHKRKRSRSASSGSSLSSAKSIPDDFGPPLALGDRQSGSVRARSAGQRQATNRATAGNRLRSAATASNSQSPGKQPVIDPALTTQAPFKKLKKSRDEPEYDVDELSQRKRYYLDDSFHDYNTIPRPESNERGPVQGTPADLNLEETPPAPVRHHHQLLTSNGNLSSPLSAQAASDTILINGSRRKRAYDEIYANDIDASTSESQSPGPLFVPPPPPGVANAASRGATPRPSRFPPPAKGVRKSARVMVSPNKPKNGGITAGISRAGPGRDVTIGNGADSGAEVDNDEFCASCGGEGKLLCCDGCTNSFHHACLEPPLDAEQEVEGEWFCPQCVARRNKSTTRPTGLLGLLLRQVGETIPRAFALPAEVRDYFEGVKTGEEGEYEEVGLPRTQNNAVKMNRAGFIEEPNYKEIRDSKGNLILCYLCGHASNGRDIIPCDYCPAKWHLDCVDPPLAVPPRRRADGKPSSSWRCPLHIDHDLAALGRQAESAPGDLGRVPRLRKPKSAVLLEVPFHRGFPNNGIIEVELMKDESVFDKTKEVHMEGKIYRVPEKSIRLDFIDRVKKSWYEDHALPRHLNASKKIRSKKYRPDGAVLHHPPEETVIKVREPDFFTGANALAITETAKANVALRKRSIKEQQTVLNLAEMSQRGIDGYSGDALAELTNALVSEAPSEVVQAVEHEEVDQLLALQDLITRRLAVLGHATPMASIERDTPAHDGDEGPSNDLHPNNIKSKMVNGDVAKQYPVEETNGTENREEDDADNEMEMTP